MRYVIYGAGAIGATTGARLHEAGHDVVLIARGAHYDTMRDSGLRYGDPERVRTLRIPVVDLPSAVDWRDGDVVFLCMKTQDTLGALQALRSSAPREIPVFCVQNGVANEEMALRFFPNVYGVSVIMPATHLEPGVVLAHSLPAVGIFDIGRYPTGIDEVARAVAADLTAAGIEAPVDEHVMRWKYAKLVSNLGNAVDAAVGMAGRQTDLMQQAKDEAFAAFRAAGIDFATDAEYVAKRDGKMSMGAVDGVPHQGSSSWQSLARGTGSIEVDYLNGEIVLLGRLHGVPTPVNEMLQRVAEQMARTGAVPGSFSIDQLQAAVRDA
jgi:2-dehydropantoate 2-reductase